MTEQTEEVGNNALQEEVTPEVVAEVTPEVVAEVTPETETAETPPPKEHGNKGKTPWYMDRINEETNKRRQVEEQLTQKAREAEEARTMLERMQAGGKETAPAKSDPADIDALVEARAAQKLFNQDCNDVHRAGITKIPGFSDKLQTLSKIGLLDPNNSDFLMDVIAVDKENAHTILSSLSENEELANSMLHMNSRRRVAELTRISMAELARPAAAAPTPKPAPVSKVPAPKPVLEAAGGVADIDEDKMTDAQWSAWRKQQMAKRA